MKKQMRKAQMHTMVKVCYEKRMANEGEEGQWGMMIMVGEEKC